MKFMAVISVQRFTKIVNFIALWSGVLLLGLGSNYHTCSYYEEERLFQNYEVYGP